MKKSPVATIQVAMMAIMSEPLRVFMAAEALVDGVDDDDEL